MILIEEWNVLLEWSAGLIVSSSIFVSLTTGWCSPKALYTLIASCECPINPLSCKHQKSGLKCMPLYVNCRSIKLLGLQKTGLKCMPLYVNCCSIKLLGLQKSITTMCYYSPLKLIFIKLVHTIGETSHQIWNWKRTFPVF